MTLGLLRLNRLVLLALFLAVLALALLSVVWAVDGSQILNGLWHVTRSSLAIVSQHP